MTKRLIFGSLVVAAALSGGAHLIQSPVAAQTPAPLSPKSKGGFEPSPNQPDGTLVREAKPQDGGGFLNSQWEYKIVTANTELEATLNELGKEGWELVAVISPTGGEKMYFKRRK